MTSEKEWEEILLFVVYGFEYFYFYNIYSMKKMNQNTLTSLFFRNSLFKKKRQHSRQSCPGNAKLVC